MVSFQQCNCSTQYVLVDLLSDSWHFLSLTLQNTKKSASQPLTIEEIHFSNPNSETGWF